MEFRLTCEGIARTAAYNHSSAGDKIDLLAPGCGDCITKERMRGI